MDCVCRSSGAGSVSKESTCKAGDIGEQDILSCSSPLCPNFFFFFFGLDLLSVIKSGVLKFPTSIVKLIQF